MKLNWCMIAAAIRAVAAVDADADEDGDDLVNVEQYERYQDPHRPNIRHAPPPGPPRNSTSFSPPRYAMKGRHMRHEPAMDYNREAEPIARRRDHRPAEPQEDGLIDWLRSLIQRLGGEEDDNNNNNNIYEPAPPSSPDRRLRGMSREEQDQDGFQRLRQRLENAWEDDEEQEQQEEPFLDELRPRLGLEDEGVNYRYDTPGNYPYDRPGSPGYGNPPDVYQRYQSGRPIFEEFDRPQYREVRPDEDYRRFQGAMSEAINNDKYDDRVYEGDLFGPLAPGARRRPHPDGDDGFDAEGVWGDVRRTTGENHVGANPRLRNKTAPQKYREAREDEQRARERVRQLEREMQEEPPRRFDQLEQHDGTLHERLGPGQLEHERIEQEQLDRTNSTVPSLPPQRPAPPPPPPPPPQQQQDDDSGFELDSFFDRFRDPFPFDDIDLEEYGDEDIVSDSNNEEDRLFKRDSNLEPRHSGAAHARIMHEDCKDCVGTYIDYQAPSPEAMVAPGTGVNSTSLQSGKWLVNNRFFIGGSDRMFNAGEASPQANIPPSAMETDKVKMVMKGYWGDKGATVYEYAYNISPNNNWDRIEVTCFCMDKLPCTCDNPQVADYYTDLKNSQSKHAQFVTARRNTHLAINGTNQVEKQQMTAGAKHDRQRANSENKNDGNSSNENGSATLHAPATLLVLAVVLLANLLLLL